MTTNQGFKNIVCDEKISHYKFFYYWLKYRGAHIENLSSGSTFSEASASLMRSLEICLPPLPEQKAIAGVLSSLDDKIELLREQNKTLEATAQTIFKEWFVNFNFPDDNGKPYKDAGGQMIDSELGEIPDGWRVGSLSEIANFLNGLALQKYPVNEGDSLPAIKIKEMNNGITPQTDRVSTNIPNQYIVNNGDVLFSWSGTLSVDIWKHGAGALNQHLFKVTSDKYPKWFYFQWIKYHLEHFKQIASAKAVTMGHIKRHHLDDALVLIPDDKYLQHSDCFMSKILQKIENNNTQIQTLSKTREEALPKLMSGEIEIKI